MLAFVLMAAQLPPVLSPKDEPIVVTAQRLQDTERDLANCLSIKCPPAEDIEKSLAHAENQFLSGDYRAARKTLLASRSRNRVYAKNLPVEVADLSRANARMAALVGLRDVARVGFIDALDDLKSGLPSRDARVLLQRIEIGDAFAREGRLVAATQFYSDVEKDARAAGLRGVEGHAMFRTAVLYGAVASVNPDYKQAADRAIARVETQGGSEMAPFRNGALLLKARLASYAGDPEAIDVALSKVRMAPSSKPVLVYAPPVGTIDRPESAVGAVPARGDSDAQWVDVSYWVTSDGTVGDVDVIRQSSNADLQWVKPVLKSLSLRRYAPLALEKGDPGVLRVERFSYVYDVVSDTGSHLKTRAPNGHLETLDLTLEPATATSASAASPG